MSERMKSVLEWIFLTVVFLVLFAYCDSEQHRRNIMDFSSRTYTLPTP